VVEDAEQCLGPADVTSKQHIDLTSRPLSFILSAVPSAQRRGG
jgi:hypothetical protein